MTNLYRNTLPYFIITKQGIKIIVELIPMISDGSINSCDHFYI